MTSVQIPVINIPKKLIEQDADSLRCQQSWTVYLLSLEDDKRLQQHPDFRALPPAELHAFLIEQINRALKYVARDSLSFVLSHCFNYLVRATVDKPEPFLKACLTRCQSGFLPADTVFANILTAVLMSENPKAIRRFLEDWPKSRPHYKRSAKIANLFDDIVEFVRLWHIESFAAAIAKLQSLATFKNSPGIQRKIKGLRKRLKAQSTIADEANRQRILKLVWELFMLPR